MGITDRVKNECTLYYYMSKLRDIGRNVIIVISIIHIISSIAIVIANRSCVNN